MVPNPLVEDYLEISVGALRVCCAARSAVQCQALAEPALALALAMEAPNPLGADCPASTAAVLEEQWAARSEEGSRA